MRDEIFVTYGARAEWNPNYGAEAEPAISQRYGLVYTHELGAFTAKVRGSYGAATKPPTAGQKNATSMLVNGTTYATIYGPLTDYYLSNPELGPVTQQGIEAGLELYYGTLGSLVITRYNQTVDNVINAAKVDSARSLAPNPPAGYYSGSLDTAGYGYYPQYQYLNLGSIRNQGWELQGTMNAGFVTAKGTYSWTKSRVIGVNAAYRAQLTSPTMQPGASYSFLPEHTWALTFGYSRPATMVSVTVNGVGYQRAGINMLAYQFIGNNFRLSADQARMGFPVNGSYNGIPSYTTADLNVMRRLSSIADAVLQVQNLGDEYQNDYDAQYAVLGRQTKVGLRVRL